jgi:ligand-binding sensor protein
MLIQPIVRNVRKTFGGDYSMQGSMEAIDQTETEQNVLERLADESGLAIVVVDENASAVSESNNNSICRALYNSEDFAPRCNEFCGKAFEWASNSDAPIEYECYAGLKCSAVKIDSNEKPLVAIVGRTFLKAENYRNATTRAISGDWNEFPPSRFFENVLLTGSEKKIEKLVKKIGNLTEEESRVIVALDEKNPIEIPPAKAEKSSETLQLNDLIKQFQNNESIEFKTIIQSEALPESLINPEEVKIWRSFFGSLLEMKYHRALASILDFV